jgi:hypothetical protein
MTLLLVLAGLVADVFVAVPTTGADTPVAVAVANDQPLLQQERRRPTPPRNRGPPR